MIGLEARRGCSSWPLITFAVLIPRICECSLPFSAVCSSLVRFSFACIRRCLLVTRVRPGTGVALLSGVGWAGQPSSASIRHPSYHHPPRCSAWSGLSLPSIRVFFHFSSDPGFRAGGVWHTLRARSSSSKKESPEKSGAQRGVGVVTRRCARSRVGSSCGAAHAALLPRPLPCEFSIPPAIRLGHPSTICISPPTTMRWGHRRRSQRGGSPSKRRD